jgi:integrase
MLGLRIWELSALKWSDWIEERTLLVTREEVRNQVTNTYHIEEHTKTHTARQVILVPKAVALLRSIEHKNEYIFVRGSERITSRQYAYILEKYAERQGIATKSTHKMRKTYASLLNANGVPLDCIREQLGHSSLSTTLSYIYNPLTEAETYDLLTKAF